ncbi:MAG: hypothetical protein OXH79_18540 [Boseongicola sp.]|nr:hypothetical protein [Boseongicola sp.]
MEEPFVPANDSSSLSVLSTKGILVEPLQTLCLEKYSAWATTRIQRILDELATMNRVPDLIVFPEGAVPIKALEIIKEFSENQDCTVLAGTHSPQGTTDAMRTYRKAGVKDNRIKKLISRGVRNALPIVSSGKVQLVEKKLFSPFERSIIATQNSLKAPGLRAFELKICGRKFLILPMICAEALQQPRLPKEYDAAIILSYDSDPSKFLPFISHQVNNRKFVAYCNDGKFGGSMVFAVDDKRRPNWIRDALPEGLPPGDSLLVFDLDFETTAVEVGTASPQFPMHLITLGSLVSETSEQFALAKAIKEIGRYDSADVRTRELGDLLKSGPLTPLQQLRFNHLYDQERRGLAATDIWDALGSDFVLRDISPLRQLEGELAASCVEFLFKGATDAASRNPEVSQALLSFVAECQKKAGSTKPFEIVANSVREPLIIDRERDTQEICAFFESEGPQVLEVTGLPQVGKSEVIKRALGQSGLHRIESINLSATSSAYFLLLEILKLAGERLEAPYPSEAEFLKLQALKRALRSISVLCISNSHFFLDHGVWRDESLEDTVQGLVELACETDTKLVFESQREIPFEFDNPAVRRRLRIRGLDVEFGRALFDTHLRHIGVPGTALTMRDKEAIIKRLGGHPVAIIVAADAVHEAGGREAVRAVMQQQGFFWKFLERLIRVLSLTDDEESVLKLFSLSRDGIFREVVVEVAGSGASSSIRNLLGLGVLEPMRYGILRLAPILRDYFDGSDLPPKQVERFHIAASMRFAEGSRFNRDDLSMAIESEYHAGLGGIETPVKTRLIDGALATVQMLYEQQKYEEAGMVLDRLLSRSRQLDVLRLAALVSARRSRLDEALGFAQEVFTRNRRDTHLLAELAKIALTQSQDRIAEKLISIARSARVEDVSILIVEGRMHLRRRDLDGAEAAFLRAKQLTRRNPWPFFYLGRTYWQLGRLDEAVEVLFEGETFCYDSNSRSRRALSAIRTQLAVVYLLLDEVDLAAPIIESLARDEAGSPEVGRAYAALTIKREGIGEAHKALKQLEKAKIRNRQDRCQYHLFCGIFYLGIGDKESASREFSHSLKADRQNVFVMMKQARTLFELAVELWTDGQDGYRDLVDDCANMVRQILRFDANNAEGRDLLADLRAKFGKDL